MKSSIPYSKEERQACRQNLMYTNELTFRRSKPDAKIIPAFYFWFLKGTITDNADEKNVYPFFRKVKIYQCKQLIAHVNGSFIFKMT